MVSQNSELRDQKHPFKGTIFPQFVILRHCVLSVRNSSQILILNLDPIYYKYSQVDEQMNIK